MKKRILFVILILFLIGSYGTNVFGKEPPTYQELFQQQMKMYETKRYIEKYESEKKEIQTELPILQDEVKEQKKEVAKQMKEAKRILLQLYGGEQVMWADLYMQLETVEDMMTVNHIAGEYTKKELSLLTDLNEDLQSLQKKEQQIKNKQKRLETLLANLEKRLKELEQDEAYYKNQLGMVKDVEKAKREVKELLTSWEEDGLDSFQEIFRILAHSIENLPNVIDKSHIKSKSIFRHELTLTDAELNQYLAKESDIFRSIHFAFDNQKLYIKGTYKGLSFEVNGHYELKKSGEIRFRIDELEFQHVKLPQITIQEMEEEYDFGIYPSEIVEGAEITKVNMDKGKFSIEVKI